MNLIPAPVGAYRAVYRDMSTPDHLVALPVIGFTPVEEPTSATIFGGPEAPQVFTQERDANPGTQAVPVVLTRRGEVRATPTVLPFASGEVFFDAPPDVALFSGELPDVAYLGIVHAHEDPHKVFGEHVTAAREHRDAVIAAREVAALPAPEPVHTVAAQVRTPDTAQSETVHSMADLYALFERANALTTEGSTNDDRA